MDVNIATDSTRLGQRAGAHAASLIAAAIAAFGRAHIILATGASQLEVLNVLRADPRIEWGKVIAFHLDEYIGLPATHPASFRRYLRERFVQHVPLGAFHPIQPEFAPRFPLAEAPAEECARLAALIAAHPIDVALVGIGENGHLAFNDPPADFSTAAPFLVVDLDERCRMQQLGEGWFASLDAVPQRAISMSVPQIMKSAAIVCSVPDRRKAEAVRATVRGPVSPLVPASILQQHANTALFLDRNSAAGLELEVTP